MDDMIGLIVLLLVVILIAPIFIFLSIRSKLSDVQKQLNNIQNKLNQFTQTNSTSTKATLQEQASHNKVEIPIDPTPNPIIKETIEQNKPELFAEKQTALELIEIDEKLANKLEVEKALSEAANKKSNIVEDKFQEPAAVQNEKLTTSKNNLEQFIGEKLISLVGIGILVLGIFFSVKWAISKNLISDAGKVMIGLVSGTILIAIAHRLIKNYRAFSSILVGGGLAVFYFSIYEAFQSYHILGQTSAFIIMIVISTLGALLAIFYNKKELAIIALLGGFLTPFFVSTGSNNYIALFSYIAILNLGIFVVAYFKNWRLLNAIAYIATILIFLGWIATKYDASLLQAKHTIIFASIFYIIFFSTNIIYNLRHGTKLIGFDFSILLSNAAIYFGIGIYCLQSFEPQNYKGIFTICLAVFNFIFAYIFYKNNKIDKNIIYLLIGLVLSFVSITAPMQLHGNYITLFWACEIVILYYLGVQSKIVALKYVSIAVLLLTLISLGMDLQQNYFGMHINKLPIIFNKAFVTTLVVIACIFIKQKFILKDEYKILSNSNINYLNSLSILLLFIINTICLLEINYQTKFYTQFQASTFIALWSFEYLFIAILMTIHSKHQQTKYIPLLACILLLLYPIANISIRELHIQYFQSATSKSNEVYLFIFIPMLALYLLYLVAKYIQSKYSIKENIYKIAAFIGTFIGLYILSSSLVYINYILNFTNESINLYSLKTKVIKIGWPILWSLVSFAMIFYGMKKKVVIFRIIALIIFGVTIVKLFIYDISNVSQGGKIAAFVILGIILLLVSFLYQKIKNLFTNVDSNS